MKAKSQNSRNGQGRTPSGGSMGESVHASPSFCLLLAFLGIFQLWLHHSNLCPSISYCLLCVSEMFFCLSFIKALVMAFRVHLNSPGWSPHFKILNWITSAKTLSPNKVTFTDSRCPRPVKGPGRFETCISVHPCAPRACGLTEESSPYHCCPCQGEYQPGSSQHSEAVQPCGKFAGSRPRTSWFTFEPCNLPARNPWQVI